MYELDNIKHERKTTIVTTSIYKKINYMYDLLPRLRNLATIDILPTEELAKMFWQVIPGIILQGGFYINKYVNNVVIFWNQVSGAREKREITWNLHYKLY